MVIFNQFWLVLALLMSYMSRSLRMNTQYLESALQRVPNPETLVNVVSRRVRQLTQGQRPLTLTDGQMEPVDIALKEISEGKLSYEILPMDSDTTEE